jgi:hypothetical protein
VLVAFSAAFSAGVLVPTPVNTSSSQLQTLDRAHRLLDALAVEVLIVSSVRHFYTSDTDIDLVCACASCTTVIKILGSSTLVDGDSLDCRLPDRTSNVYP